MHALRFYLSFILALLLTLSAHSSNDNNNSAPADPSQKRSNTMLKSFALLSDEDMFALIERANSGDESAQEDMLTRISYMESVDVKFTNRMKIQKWNQIKKAETDDVIAGAILTLMYTQNVSLNKIPNLFKNIINRAQQGIPLAQYYLGTMYELGRFVSKDNKKAVEFYTKAANQGHACSQGVLAEKYFTGTITQKNHDLAFQWAMKAAELGDPRSQFLLGAIYLARHENKIDKEKATVNLEKAILNFSQALFNGQPHALSPLKTLAEQGSVGAQVALGIFYNRSEKHDLHSQQQALKWLTMAANKGHARAEFLLGKLFFEGHESIRDHQKGYKLFLSAANKGNVEAQYTLHFFHVDEPVNIPEAVKWLEMAARQNHADALAKLIDYADNGHDIALFALGGIYEKDGKYDEAFKCYAEAADEDHALALTKMGNFCFLGLGTPKDLQQAIKCYKKAARLGCEDATNKLKAMANRGNADAQYAIGRLYYEGSGLAQSYENAYEMFKLAAQKDVRDAIYRLGFMHANQQGVEEDFNLAATYFKKASKLGSPGGHTNLGYFYEKGLGVEKNLKKAIKLYKLAADLKVEYAERKLARLVSEPEDSEEEDDSSNEELAVKQPTINFIPIEEAWEKGLIKKEDEPIFELLKAANLPVHYFHKPMDPNEDNK